MAKEVFPVDAIDRREWLSAVVRAVMKVDITLVGMNKLEAGRLSYKPNGIRQLVLGPSVVGIEERHPFSGRKLEPSVSGRCSAGVMLIDVLYSRIRAAVPADYVSGMVRRTVVDNQKFVNRVCLSQRRPDRRIDSRFAIVRRQYYADWYVCCHDRRRVAAIRRLSLYREDI